MMKTFLSLFCIFFALIAFSQTPPANSPKIKLIVSKDTAISIDFWAMEPNAKIWIEAQENVFKEVLIASNSEYIGYVSYKTLDTIMNVYGELRGFDCSTNQSRITKIDASQNPSLKELRCNFNEITEINVSQNTGLEQIWCFLNKLEAIDISACKKLKIISCGSNQIKKLDLTNNPVIDSVWFAFGIMEEVLVGEINNISDFDGRKNNLKNINLSSCKNLKNANLGENLLEKFMVCDSALKLDYINCNTNNLDACNIDTLLRSLPINSITDKLVVLKNAIGSNPGVTGFQDTIASNRGWIPFDNSANVGAGAPIVNMSYTCLPSAIAEGNTIYNIYPNPANNLLNIECENAKNIYIFDILGKEVLEMSNNISDTKVQINVSDLICGIYFVKIELPNKLITQKVIIQ